MADCAIAAQLVFFVNQIDIDLQPDTGRFFHGLISRQEWILKEEKKEEEEINYFKKKRKKK